MSKYDQMVIARKMESMEKINRAKAEINNMVAEHDPVSIYELTKRTGYSRTFFYNNEEVRECYYKARSFQKGDTFKEKREETWEKTLKMKIKILEKENAALVEQNEKLRKENAALSKRVDQSARDFIKSLKR